MQRSSQYRHVGELRLFANTSQQKTPATHVAASNEFARKHEPLPEDAE